MNSTTACTLCFCSRFTRGKGNLCLCTPPNTLFGLKHGKGKHTRVIGNPDEKEESNED